MNLDKFHKVISETPSEVKENVKQMLDKLDAENQIDKSMTAEQWLEIIKKSKGYNPELTPLIEKYGELLIDEEFNKRQTPEEIKEGRKRLQGCIDRGEIVFFDDDVNSPTPTIGQILTGAIMLHELNPEVVEKELDFPKGILKKLMNDEYYTNSVPVVLFKNLLMSLHIPFSVIEAAMLPTFKVLKSKETSDTLKKKPHGYELWENEISLGKYTRHLKDLMLPTLMSESGAKVNSEWPIDPKFGGL